MQTLYIVIQIKITTKQYRYQSPYFQLYINKGKQWDETGSNDIDDSYDYSCFLASNLRNRTLVFRIIKIKLN